MNMTQTTASHRPRLRRNGDDRAVEFNVSSTPQFLRGTIPAGLAGAQNYSFSMRIRARGDLTVSSVAATLFGVTTTAAGSSTGGVGFTLSSPNGGDVVFRTGAAPSANWASGTSVISDGAWHFLTGTASTGDRSRLYHNGAQVAETTEASSAFASSFSDLFFALGAADNGTRFVPMEASDLQIWDTTLTPTQVTELAMSRFPRDGLPAGLIWYVPLVVPQ